MLWFFVFLIRCALLVVNKSPCVPTSMAMNCQSFSIKPLPLLADIRRANTVRQSWLLFNAETRRIHSSEWVKSSTLTERGRFEIFREIWCTIARETGSSPHHVRHSDILPRGLRWALNRASILPSGVKNSNPRVTNNA